MKKFGPPSQKSDSNVSLRVSDNQLLAHATSFLQLNLIAAWTETKSIKE